MTDAPVNPYLLGYDVPRYSVDLTDVATRDQLSNPAVEARVIADAAKCVAREYETLGYKPNARAIRQNGHAPRRHGRIIFPHFHPPEGEPVLIVDPQWYGLYLPSPAALPLKSTMWAMAGDTKVGILPDGQDRPEHEMYPPLWLDLETGQWVAFTTVPHEYTGMPRSMCRPYIGRARGYDQPPPPDPEAEEKVQLLHLKTTSSRYAELDYHTR